MKIHSYRDIKLGTVFCGFLHKCLPLRGKASMSSPVAGKPLHRYLLLVSTVSLSLLFTSREFWYNFQTFCREIASQAG